MVQYSTVLFITVQCGTVQCSVMHNSSVLYRTVQFYVLQFSVLQDEACLYSTLGFCKFKDNCKRIHYREKCEDSALSQGTKVCHKRHPKACKRHQTLKGCQFGSDCAYEHRESETFKAPTNELEKKIEVLETIVVEMANNLVKL